MVIELDSHYENQKETIEGIVRAAVEASHIELSQTSFDNLIIHLSLCVSRELNGTYIPTSESQMNHLKEHQYYEISKAIIKALEKEFDVSIDDNQTSYTTMYLANINLLDIDFNYEFDLFDDVMEAVINKTIYKIKDELDIDLTTNQEFYSGITLHFFPAIERLKNNQQLTSNPLKDQIQSQHELEFKCAKIFNSVVEEHYQQSFNNNELAYIAMHFGTATQK